MAERWRGTTTRRVSGRGGRSRAWRSTAPVATEPPAPALGSLLATINRHDLEELYSDPYSVKEPPKITNCELLGSYNWLNQTCPTILVPGAPPAWTPAPTSEKLSQDAGSYFRDQNAARYSVHVFQPALEAILKQNPEIDLDEIDLIACASTLRRFLQFVTEPDREFRILVETVGSTVFLVRRENSPTQTITGVYGYGHTFPEANTTWEPAVKGSESHQRILLYQFAGLSCAIRYEGDGYLPGLHRLRPCPGKATPVTTENLLTSLEGNTVSPVAAKQTQALTTKTGGEAVPQSAMFDLKTRSSRKEYRDVLKEELPRLWAAQVPNFVVAFHSNGVFHDVRIEDVREEIQQWEEDHENCLGKLAALLKMLIAFARGQPDGRFEAVLQSEDGELELRKVGGEANSCISDSMENRWVGKDHLGGTTREEKKQLDARKDAGGTEQREEGCEEGWKEKQELISGGWNDDSDSEKDFTACSASSCGYCGHCGY